MTVSLAITDETEAGASVDQTRLELAVACALEAAGYPADEAVDEEDGEVEINLCVVEREASARLNHAYRGKDYATNVLSFPAGAEVPGLLALGDLVICMPVVVEEASGQNKQLDAHLLHLVVHGTLHLLGFDHVGDDDAETMEELERRVLAGFGVADPYVSAAGADSAS